MRKPDKPKVTKDTHQRHRLGTIGSLLPAKKEEPVVKNEDQ